MSLLIGSVYPDHHRNAAWYELQMKFLHRTTINFTHVVYVNGKENIYNQSEVIALNEDIPVGEYIGQQAHIRGLNAIISHFNSRPKYKNLLLLDNDCFPIQAKWQHDLDTIMERNDVAAIVRCENLDLFAHPSAFFVRRRQAAKLKFDVMPHINMVGEEFKDTASNVTNFFPMIRTNKFNHHPMLCGVYWNRFYHHGAGSRSPLFRVSYHYYKDASDLSTLEEKLFEELANDPEAFLNKLGEPITTRKMY